MNHHPARAPGQRIALACLALAGCGGDGAGGEGTAVPNLPGDPAALEMAVDRVVEEAMAVRGIPGLSLTILHRGRPVLSKGYGVADVEAGTPARPETVYRIGSISKQFTTATLLRLAEEGGPGLDDPLADLLPGVPDAWAPIRLRHLLGMTSGIPDFLFLPGFGELDADTTRGSAELISLVVRQPLLFPPGERWSYSNSNFTLAAALIESLTGRDYAAVMGDAFFRPLGLESLHHCRQVPAGPAEARGYAVREGRVTPSPPENVEMARGDGALCGNAPDLARWMAALAGGEVVGPEGFRRMTTPDPLADGSEPPYGLSLSLIPLDGTVRKVAHQGAMSGFTGMLAHYPESGLTVSLLSNLGGVAGDALEEAVTRAVLGLPTPGIRALPLGPEMVGILEGRYHTGVFPLDLVPFGDGLALEAPGPVPSGPLLYLGEGRFALEREPLGVTVQVAPGGGSLVLRMAGMQWFGERVPPGGREPGLPRRPPPPGSL